MKLKNVIVHMMDGKEHKFTGADIDTELEKPGSRTFSVVREAGKNVYTLFLCPLECLEYVEYTWEE